MAVVDGGGGEKFSLLASEDRQCGPELGCRVTLSTPRILHRVLSSFQTLP